jgi:phage major head subunit gpT-like protein
MSRQSIPVAEAIEAYPWFGSWRAVCDWIAERTGRRFSPLAVSYAVRKHDRNNP